MRLEQDDHLADLLHRNPNFEEALTELQNEVATSARPGIAERLQKLEAAIVDVFGIMNRNLGAATFNFCNDLKYSLPEFVVLFDAIFTLNQDLLLEKHYLYPPQIISRRHQEMAWRFSPSRRRNTRSWSNRIIRPVARAVAPAAFAERDCNRSAIPALLQIARIDELDRLERRAVIGNGWQQADHHAPSPYSHVVRRQVHRAPLKAGCPPDGHRLRLQR
jgi:hypothetical protein